MTFKILLAVGLVIVAFLGYVASLPDDFHIERSARIKAPPEKIFEQLNDLRKFNVWNPWAKMDPNAKMTFEGPASGVGAVSAWQGNSQIGEGKMTIIESVPAQKVRMQLEFFKPFPGISVAEFTLKPEGEMTAVTWGMSGKSHFIPKMMCVFMNMDKMMGGEFEKGLAALKSIAEAEIAQR